MIDWLCVQQEGRLGERTSAVGEEVETSHYTRYRNERVLLAVCSLQYGCLSTAIPRLLPLFPFPLFSAFIYKKRVGTSKSTLNKLDVRHKEAFSLTIQSFGLHSPLIVFTTHSIPDPVVRSYTHSFDKTTYSSSTPTHFGRTRIRTPIFILYFTLQPKS
jgi:hypothetical protein